MQLAQALLSQARRREQFFPNIVFYDPQWLMVLDLFVATAQGRDLAISSVCIASGAANATAWRNIRLLEDRGIILRTPHPSDRRSRFLKLSLEGRQQVCAYLRAFDESVIRRTARPF
jgi:DNA-binding IclR family transcriptional regulator